MIIAVDAMGGDHAPGEIVKGVVKAAAGNSSLTIRLYGDEKQIQPLLGNEKNIEVIHTDEVILSTDEPVRAVRRKKNASMVLMAQAVKDKEADACVSAGNTGALMAAGLFVVGRIKGIDRPALSPTLPTIDGQGFVMLDLGANADAKPEHILQYAIMGSIYAEQVRGIKNPTVGLLNIGTEEGKGNDLTKQAYALLQESGLNFVGNVESRDLLNGVSDVVVTDGFTGNMVLKTIEGTAQALFGMLKETFTSSVKTKLAAGLVKNDLRQLKGKLDYTEYGGAGLFGLNAPVIKAHGSSNATAVYNAIKQAHTMAENDVSGKISASLNQ
ncbi:phosphate acyltransferase PlsX [Jeotgalibacillus haloalkalitolerans]|uniref:Phosphate acyltransferase n=1 Tax=Jeotgalibacillus haloalkalitolerans TaxID=3104292 RepID=A0ABU5KKI7_9BACL|nr:phosphate acyltransferase PlsX [Jeotgalibacillus sp. HH7-29]MDZ5711685.1 phosphate acyltransferase PlsX [Jeotgalibacillus sp. HH7-29]